MDINANDYPKKAILLLLLLFFYTEPKCMEYLQMNTKPHIYLSKKEDSKAIEDVDIMRALSNDISLLLFDTIANAVGTSDLLISKLNVTRKQFYSRMSYLMKCGLVKRMNGKYILTSFGKIVYSVKVTLKKACECYSKLKVIDLLETSGDKILKDEQSRIIDVLLEENPQIKQIVVK